MKNINFQLTFRSIATLDVLNGNIIFVPANTSEYPNDYAQAG